MTKFTRKQILKSLNDQIKKKRAILAAGSSCGLVAKCSSEAGADLIVVYSTGKSRLMGLPTSRIGDSNKETIKLCSEIQNVTKKTPIIGGVEAWDPTNLDTEKLLDNFMEAGYSGIINYPTISTMGDKWRNRREKVGLGFNKEIELIKKANKKNIFSMAYVAEEKDAVEMAKAGADCIVPHVGATKGGISGFSGASKLSESIKKINSIIKSCQKYKKSIFLAHGGEIAEPRDTEKVYANTLCKGFVGASSIERIPIENAITNIVKEFKSKKT